MKQEEKDLLIKDLCGRLPYGVKGTNAHGMIVNLDHPTDYSPYMSIKNAVLKHDYKPYLFPMSSMTEEQRKNWFKESNVNYDCEFHIEPTISIDFCHLSIDWLNAHHFDYRDLIKKDLAIDATNLNIY